MRLALYILIIMLNTAPFLSFIYITVPNGLFNVEGNSYSYLTFGSIEPVRYQQVYAATQFSQLPPGGAFISRIFFRADCPSSAPVSATNFQMNLSTTLKYPDQLSMVFSENIGADETVVFGPKYYLPPSPCGTNCPCTFSNGREVSLAAPFLYNPANGNLLIDLRISAIQAGGYRLDAQNSTNDSVSCVAAYSLQSNTATVVRTTGVITYFEFVPAPTLTALIDTNTLVLAIPLYPEGFQLQYSYLLNNNSTWYNINPQTEQIGFFKYARLPLNRSVKSQFYRLFWQNPGVQHISLSARAVLTPDSTPATHSLLIPLNPSLYDSP